MKIYSIEKRKAVMDIANTEVQRQMKRKVTGEFFREFCAPLMPVFRNLALSYKRRRSIPMVPVAAMASFYTDRKDKEIAAYAGMLLTGKAGVTKIRELRDMLGDSPYGWFREREFLKYNAGSLQKTLIGGVYAWKVAELMEHLYDGCHSGSGGTMCAEIERLAAKFGCPFETVIEHLTDGCLPEYDYQYRIRILMMVLLTSYGIGQRVYKVEPEQLRCPIDRNVMLFLKTWFPDYKLYGDVDEGIRLFGFDQDSDFWYASLAYRELVYKRRNECRILAESYERWYKTGHHVYEKEWDRVLAPFRKLCAP